MALTENMAREDLTPIEAARGCQALRDTFGLSLAEIARRVGRDRTAISHLTRLLQLPDRAQALIQEGRLSAGHGSILLRLEDHDARRELAIQCAESGWSVRELERHVDARNAAPAAARLAPPADELAALQTLSESLEPVFGAIGVSIVRGRRSYRIALDCASYDEVVGVVARMRGLPSAVPRTPPPADLTARRRRRPDRSIETPGAVHTGERYHQSRVAELAFLGCPDSGPLPIASEPTSP